MRKIKILISLIAISFSTILQASTVDSVFLKLPTKVLPLLDGKARHEMLEYIKAGQTDSVKNKLGGFARILYRDTTQQHIVLKPILVCGCNTANERLYRIRYTSISSIRC